MKISLLKIKSLFGLYDYSISFTHEGENFTVLTSPNGYGKTTLLRIINSLHVSRLYYLYLLKFENLEIRFDDGSKLFASEGVDTSSLETGTDTIKDVRRGLSFVWYLNNQEICRFDYLPNVLVEAKSIASRRVSSFRHTPFEIEENDTSFIDGELGQTLNEELARIQGQEQFFLQLATLQTDFIGANRIYNASNTDRYQRYRHLAPVVEIVRELKARLMEAVVDFQNNFQRLDSKLIDKLLEDKGREISEEEYYKRASLLSDKIEELVKYGLTNKQTLPQYNSDNNKASILDVYLDLMEEKLLFYKDLLPLVRLFSKNVNEKHFANKNIRISPQHGLRIESDNGDILRADLLSTGEQNQLVLLYDLIFKTPQGSILLIDEPESSLHVAWQNDFVNDMQEISRVKQLQIVIATHSPIIVSNTPEKQVFDLFYLQKKI